MRRKLAASALGLIGLFVGISWSLGDEPARDPAPEVREKKVWVAPLVANGPVARVGSREVSAEVFNTLATRLAQGARGMLPESQLALYRDQLIERAIDRHFLNEAMKERGVTVSEEEIAAAWEAHLDRTYMSEASRRYFLENPNNDIEALEANLGEQIRERRFIVEWGKIKITREEIAAYHAQYARNYREEATIRARQILLALPVDADQKEIKRRGAQAAELVEKLRSGEKDFAEAARRLSDDVSAVRGGDLGVLQRRRMMEGFSDVAFAQEVGVISDPVRTRQGWHIIEVLEKTPERLEPLEEVEEAIRESMMERKIRKSLNRFLSQQRRSARIEKLPENVEIRPGERWRFVPEERAGELVPSEASEQR